MVLGHGELLGLEKNSFRVKCFPSWSLEHQNFASDSFSPTPCLSAPLSLSGEADSNAECLRLRIRQGSSPSSATDSMVLDKVILCFRVSGDVISVTIKVSR